MNELTSTSYTSPSGATYEVVPTNKYGWFRFEIFRNGEKVQFALNEQGVAASVAHYENPGPDVSSPRD
jgi:hypothetical protein